MVRWFCRVEANRIYARKVYSCEYLIHTHTAHPSLADGKPMNIITKGEFPPPLYTYTHIYIHSHLFMIIIRQILLGCCAYIALCADAHIVMHCCPCPAAATVASIYLGEMERENRGGWRRGRMLEKQQEREREKGGGFVDMKNSSSSRMINNSRSSMQLSAVCVYLFYFYFSPVLDSKWKTQKAKEL